MTSLDPECALVRSPVSMVLASFLLGLALVLGATAFAAVRGVGLWRVAKKTGGQFTAELALFEERSARTERLLAEADASSRNLQVALERLRVSQARLQVLRDALQRSQERVRWLRVFLPL
jgi:hypothetical protein